MSAAEVENPVPRANAGSGLGFGNGVDAPSDPSHTMFRDAVEWPRCGLEILQEVPGGYSTRSRRGRENWPIDEHATSAVRVYGTFQAQLRLICQERVALADQGVCPDLVADGSVIRAGYVVDVGQNQFEFEAHVNQEGVRALLFLQPDQLGLHDIVAWLPGTDCLLTWLGRAWALGQERITAPRLDSSNTLPVWRSPLAWLRARRRGIVLLPGRRVGDRLDDVGPLLAEDVSHALQLREHLLRRGPRILVSPKHRRVA